MKHLACAILFFVFLVPLSSYAQGMRTDLAIDKAFVLSDVETRFIRGDVGVRFVSSGGGGSSSVSGSPLFTGHTSSSSTPEFFVRFRPAGFSYHVPENVAIEGNISMPKSVHEIKFVGASLGKKTCSQVLGLSAQWWFGENKSKVRPYVGAGFERSNCSGEYALGGTRFTQSQSSNNSAVFRAGVKFDLSDLMMKNFSASIDLKTTGKHESSGTPVAGTIVTSKTGGGTSAGFGIQYGF